MIEIFDDAEVKHLRESNDKQDVLPKHMWKRMGEMCLLGITVEQEFGGLRLGYYEHCMVTEELIKANGALALSQLVVGKVLMTLNLSIDQVVTYQRKNVW